MTELPPPAAHTLAWGRSVVVVQLNDFARSRIFRDRKLANRQNAPVSTESFERVYKSRYGNFLRTAVAILRDVDAAHDAVQEAFARAISARGEFRGQATIEGWIYRILVNACLTQLRATTRMQGISAENGAVPDHGWADWPEVRAIVAALPERQRLVLFLRHYADLPYDQIAEALEVDRGTVAAALHAAHSRIRKALEEART